MVGEAVGGAVGLVVGVAVVGDLVVGETVVGDSVVGDVVGATVEGESDGACALVPPPPVPLQSARLPISPLAERRAAHDGETASKDGRDESLLANPHFASSSAAWSLTPSLPTAL